MKRFHILALTVLMVLMLSAACFAQTPVDQSQPVVTPEPTWEAQWKSASKALNDALANYDNVKRGVDTAQKRVTDAEADLQAARDAKTTAETDAATAKDAAIAKAEAMVSVLQSRIDDLKGN